MLNGRIGHKYCQWHFLKFIEQNFVKNIKLIPYFYIRNILKKTLKNIKPIFILN